jgi:hypothetical protein
MLERTDAITNEVLEPVTFVLAYHIVCFFRQVQRLKLPMSEERDGDSKAWMVVSRMGRLENNMAASRNDDVAKE